MYTVYILKSQKDLEGYIGITQNLQRCYLEHQNGFVNSTRYRRPFKLVHTEQYDLKSEAIKREDFFNTGKGREYLKNQLII